MKGYQDRGINKWMELIKFVNNIAAIQAIGRYMNLTIDRWMDRYI